MNKVKISSGLAAIVLLASLFSGWTILLTVSILMLLFCEMNETIKQVMVKVITFYVGLTIVNLAWELIVDGVNLITSSLNQLIAVINSYLTEPINIYKLELYLLSPLTNIVSLIDGIVVYLLVFAKFMFIIAILGNKPMKENFIVKKINEFISKAIAFINSFEITSANVQQQPVYQNQPNIQAQQVVNQQPMQNPNYPNQL